MNNKNINFTTRLGAYSAIGGSLIMIVGAALGIASGADLDLALASGDTASYLTTAGAASQMVTANLIVWIIGVIIFGVAGTALAALCEQRQMMAQIARYSYWISVPLVIAAYVAWLTIVVQIAPDNSPTAVLLTEVVGWFASRADWIATILILSCGPALISLAGRDEWVPTWLVRWGYVAIIAGLLNAIAMLTGGSGLLTYGLLILPVGLGWTIAAGIVVLQRSKTTQLSEKAVVSSH